MEEKPNYYAVIPAEVRYDSELKDKAKLLYGEIASLSDKKGYCYASNKYFSELYGVSTTTISTLIKNLVDRGYIESKIIYKGGTKEILNRYLKIFKYPIKENLKENNTSINNKESINKLILKKVFKKPTKEEIEEYCKERGNSIDAETFVDFYESKNWMIGKNKMKDWKACIRTWEKRQSNVKNKTIEPEWFDKKINSEMPTKDEQQEIEKVLGELIGE